MRYCELEKRITETLKRPQLPKSVVISACGRLSERLAAGFFEEKIRQAGLEGFLTAENVSFAASCLSEEQLRRRVETELSCFGDRLVMPLGVLTHVAAGNVPGIGAYSVLEGLLAGNINLLKLPSSGDVLSVFLLNELIRLEPALAAYIYTFRISSENQERLAMLLKLSDGVCTWGGEAAVAGIRNLAPPGVKLIEWGHRISFAYVTRKGLTQTDQLKQVADYMIRTNQLLCSSCQGIYVEAEKQEAEAFCRSFLQLLERSCAQYGNHDPGFRGSNTVRVCRKELETAMTEERMFKGKGVSVLLSDRGDLELSLMYGNCWVKTVKREELIEILFRDRGKLQTVMTVCSEEERPDMHKLLARAGANRIVTGEKPETGKYFGIHDGEYPLIRYSRVIETSD